MLDFFQKKWFIPIALLFVLMPLLLNLFFVYGEVKTGAELGNVEWLAFWGSYLGGAATLTAVGLTLWQNTKVIKQNEKIIIQNQKNLNFQEERSRIALMPYLDVRASLEKEWHKLKFQPPNGFITLSYQETALVRFDIPESYHKIIETGMIEEASDFVITMKASNINFVPLMVTQKAPSFATNIQLSVCKSGEQKETSKYLTPKFVLSSGESAKLPLLFEEDWPEGEYKFTLSFEDIEGHQYEQFFTILHKGSDGYKFSPVSSPKLQSNNH